MSTEKQRAAEAAFKPSTKALSGQKLEIVSYINSFGSITPMEAWNILHCTKLATRIGEIEKWCGVEFKHEKESNGVTSYMRYSFAEGYGVLDYLTAA